MWTRILFGLVVVALGANWNIQSPDIGRMVHVLGPTWTLVLVTPREDGGGSGSDAGRRNAA